MASSFFRISGSPISPAWMMWSDPRRARSASGRSKPWVSEMTPMFMAAGRFTNTSSRSCRCRFEQRIGLGAGYVGQLEAKVARIGGIGHAGFKIDDPGADQLLNLSVKILHAFGCADEHGIEHGFSLALPFF